MRSLPFYFGLKYGQRYRDGLCYGLGISEFLRFLYTRFLFLSNVATSLYISLKLPFATKIQKMFYSAAPFSASREKNMFRSSVAGASLCLLVTIVLFRFILLFHLFHFPIVCICVLLKIRWFQ